MGHITARLANDLPAPCVHIISVIYRQRAT